ncbi:MAG: flagellar protein FlgN [Succinivibrionaceae bacterium]|nr:flagellar protein FlgN [Succinivibrionaceae bacterium]
MMNMQNQAQGQLKPVFKPVQKPAVKPLGTYLAEQRSILDQLLRLLRNEKQAIRQRAVDAISQLAEDKSALMLRLQSNDQRLKLHPEAALLKTAHAGEVEEIRKALKECKRQNESNGILINLCLTSSRRLSSVLVNVRDRMTMNMTYTGKGNTTARGPMRLSIVA